MRRIPPWFIKDKLIRNLIYGSGSLAQARNELRWLKQEIHDPQALKDAVHLRGRFSYPLQYILKSQPFGPLDIICEPGALIPRWETEEWATQLASVIREESQADMPPPRILDICTGTGCILFLLCELLKSSGVGLDLSRDALDVFRKNQHALHMQGFTTSRQVSLFDPLTPELRECDVVVSNPPYILQKKDVEYSVSRFEPSVALYEPPDLWPALVSRTLESKASRAVFEVGEREQIDSVIELFNIKGWKAEGRKDSAGKWRTVWATRSSSI